MLGINDLLALVSNNNNSNMDAAQVRNKVINLLLLTASFGFALYQILNIDHGMTRGWTQSVSSLCGALSSLPCPTVEGGRGEYR
jgi:hypothetical protein